MSVREEDRQKNSTGRGVGLGVAAAAIGVGVGAALYCFFSKTPETPHGEGSTSQRWNCEETLNTHHQEDLDASTSSEYTTLYEETTTDTSLEEMIKHSSSSSPFFDSDYQLSSANISDHTADSLRDVSVDFSSTFDVSDSWQSDDAGDDSMTEWDVTSSSVDVPSDVSRVLTLGNVYGRHDRATNANIEHRQQNFRQRTWSLEECSICFEVILKDQKIMTLPCTHHFHEQCIGPWLQEQQTCPNCRKAI